VQRLIRLMPLAMLATILGYVTLATCVTIFEDDISHPAMLSRLLPEMFLIPAVSLGANDDLFKFNVPLWSLLFELLANVIYILIVPLLTRRVLIATVVFSAVILAILSIANGTTDGGSELPNAPLGMARAAFGFFAGVLIFRLVGSPSQPATRTTWLAMIPMFALVPMALMPAEGELKPFLQLFAVMGMAPLIVLLGQRFEPPRFMHPFLRWAGEMSFAVYVFHWPLLMVLRYYEEANPGSLTSLGPIVGVVFLAVVVVVSWVLSTFVDAPIRKWLTQLTRRHRAASAPRPVGS
jgi:peptidoglycan/LPS O-acetylase OafA/YrhL